MERQPRGREELEAAACVWRKPLLQKNQERESSRGRTWKSWSSEKTSSHYPALFNETTISPLCFYCSLKLRLIFMKGGKYNEEEFSEKNKERKFSKRLCFWKEDTKEKPITKEGGGECDFFSRENDGGQCQ